MFWFTQEPSSRSYNQCLAKITGLVQKYVSVQTALWWHILTVIKGSIGGMALRKILIYDNITYKR